MLFPKSLSLWIAALVLLFALALLLFVYFQGGVSHAIRSAKVFFTTPLLAGSAATYIVEFLI
ncbi:MAG TPA: hypothetical protein VFC10_06810 [Terriglobia bacterium]|nr:hypothetical protein [Terriglobia bacterium]